MHGLGDNLHQRAVVRHLLAQGHELGLVTPWPQVYYDLPVRCYFPADSLRTQKANMAGVTGVEKVTPAIEKSYEAKKRIWYTAQGVRKTGGFLPAMFDYLCERDYNSDFSFPSPALWKYAAAGKIAWRAVGRPVLFYRPLVARAEWPGCDNRNPDKDIYAQLINRIRDRFFVVSVADLKPDIEWITSEPVHADLTFHAGELSFELIAGLMLISSLVFCSPGFALVMAQAIGTPAVCVFGGRENSSAYSIGAQMTPTLGIDPINPCLCFDHLHNCDKWIDIDKAQSALEKFIVENKCVTG